MSMLSISEAGSVQFPMVRHAADVGWTPIPPDDAKRLRGGEAGMLFRDLLGKKLLEFNPWLTEEAARSIVETMDAIPATIEGNREMLSWMRGEHSWYDEEEKRHRRVTVIDFENPTKNEYHVTWEWTLKPPARKANRADVMFVVNGIPVCIVEHKNPKLGDAIERGISQLKRYELETPELIGSPQLFNVTHLLQYWYGVTWQATRRDMARWKQPQEETYKFAVQSFFEHSDFLRTLEHWILFYVKDGELRKSVLREHQRRAIHAIIERCENKEKTRGLIWHTQGSGKTFTLLTAAKMILEQEARFQTPTVILVVDRTELEGQLKGWVERLLGEIHNLGFETYRATRKNHLRELLEADRRGLILSMIHKFEEMPKDICTRENVFLFIDEAHRSVAKDLGTYLMAAVPNATIIGFTGTPIAKTAYGQGTFKIFGYEGEPYLDRYTIRESIDDETTLPIRHTMAPSEMVLPAEELETEFYQNAAFEDVTDVDELNRVLDRSVRLKTFLKADDRIEKVSKFVAEHFKDYVLPLGYKAFLVAVDREACAKYKVALDKYLPPEWSEAIYSESANDAIDHPLVAEHQLSQERDEEVRQLFVKPDKDPKIFIVTDRLLTGYDAPVLYCMYLDKPMRDHVLLQAISRVNRPYVDANGIAKKVGLVVDFVSVLRNLKKALQFDSSDVEGAIQDLDLLLEDFLEKIAIASETYLEDIPEGSPDEQLEKVVYGKFLDKEVRKKFFEDFKDIEILYEILSPSPELRDYIVTFKRLTALYATVRNAYAEQTNFVSDLAYKTRKLIEENATQDGLGRLTKSVTFDVATIEALKNASGPDEGKVFNLVRGLQREIDEDPNLAPVLQSFRDRAERILKEIQESTLNGLAAMDLIAALAIEKEQAMRAASESGLSSKAFGVFLGLKNEPELAAGGVLPMDIARESDALLTRFPNAAVNSDEKRRFRSSLYHPLAPLPIPEKTRLVDKIMAMLFGA